VRHLVPIISLMLAAGAGADTYIVRPDGTGNFPTIQAAVDAALDGDVIELSDGVFIGPGNRDIDYLGEAVTIRSQSDLPEVCVIDCEGSPADEHRGFIFQSGEGPESGLEDVTITNGFIASGEWPLNAGGGILCRLESSPTISKVIFEGNTGLVGGGGMECTGGSSPSLSACRFLDNKAPDDAAGAEGTFVSSSHFVDCEFYGNSALRGGCVYSTFSSLEFERCRFDGNVAQVSGGVWYSSTHDIGVLSNCTLLGNQAPVGSAISSGGGHLTISDTIIAFNLVGDAVHCSGGSVEAACCDIYGNTGGDWTGCIADQLGNDGNISQDPLFCDPEVHDFTLGSDSPCVPENNPECGLVGAWPVGCGGPSAVERTTGLIKGRFRGSRLSRP